MLEAESSSAALGFWSPVRKAWAVLLAAFMLFCMFSAGGIYGLTRFWHLRTQLILSASSVQSVTVLVQRAGMVTAVQMKPTDDLGIGDRLIVNNAGPGIAATIQLFPGQVALWARTNVEVAPTAPNQPIQLGFGRGQLMVDLASTSRPLNIELENGQIINLTAPGRYRIRRLDADTLTTAISEQGSVPGTELAVEQGFALLGKDRLDPGQRRLLQADRVSSFANEWPLLRDGDFSAFSDVEYNNTQVPDSTLPKADTWRVSLQDQAASGPTPKLRNGQFHLEEDCNQTSDQTTRCRMVGRFVRLGGNEQSSITAIIQPVDADVVAYRQVMLSADIRIKHQSLSKGGVLGTECPVMIRVWYANTQSTNLEVDFCFWAIDYADQKGAESNNPWIKSYQINPQTWHRFKLDLKAEIPDLLTIDKIEVNANGHDYETNIADIRLDGVDLTNQPLITPPAPKSLGASGDATPQ